MMARNDAVADTETLRTRLLLLFQRLETAVASLLSGTDDKMQRPSSLLCALRATSSSHALHKRLEDCLMSHLQAGKGNRALAVCVQLYCRVVGVSNWVAVLLSCKLMVAALSAVDTAHIPLCAYLRGFAVACRAAVRELLPPPTGKAIPTNVPIGDPLVKQLSWSDLDTVLEVARTALAASLLGGRVRVLNDAQQRHVAVSLLTALLASLDAGGGGGAAAAANIVYRHAPGLPVDATLVLENALAMDIPVPAALLDAATRGRDRDRGVEADSGKGATSGGNAGPHVATTRLVVAIFECSLELPDEAAGADAFDVHVASEPDSVRAAEQAHLDRVAALCRRSGVTLLACQRRAHPYLVRALAASGILCLPRLSIRYCGALQRLSGARQIVALPGALGAADVLSPDCLGYLGAVECRTIHGRRYVVATGGSDDDDDSSGDDQCSAATGRATALARRVPVTTMVIAAPCERLCEALERAVDDTKRALLALLAAASSATEGARIVPAGGRWQRVVAARLQQVLLVGPPEKEGSRRTKAAASTAAAAAGTVVVAGGDDVVKVVQLFIDALRQCGDVCARAKVSAGTNSTDDDDDDGGGGWEPLVSATGTLELAVEAATCILSLDLDGDPVISVPAHETKRY
jgi:hypothetical protein